MLLTEHPVIVSNPKVRSALGRALSVPCQRCHISMHKVAPDIRLRSISGTEAALYYMCVLLG